MAQNCYFGENEILVDFAAVKLVIIVLPLEKAFDAYAKQQSCRSDFACLLFEYINYIMRKPAFCICENKSADQLGSNCELISAFVFTI